MKTIQYIKEVSTLEELKKAYKKLAVMYHPDLGGDTAIMQAINNEYDYLFEELKNVHKNQKGEYYTKETDEKPEAWREVMKVNRKITKAKKQMKIICSACFFALFIMITPARAGYIGNKINEWLTESFKSMIGFFIDLFKGMVTAMETELPQVHTYYLLFISLCGILIVAVVGVRIFAAIVQEGERASGIYGHVELAFFTIATPVVAMSVATENSSFLPTWWRQLIAINLSLVAQMICFALMLKGVVNLPSGILYFMLTIGAGILLLRGPALIHSLFQTSGVGKKVMQGAGSLARRIGGR